MDFTKDFDSYVHGWILVGIVTCLALLLYTYTLVKVGKARVDLGVKAPATTGNADFERYLRVQLNTLENLILFLPSLWMFAIIHSPKVAAFFGVIWIAGRIIYAKDYYEAAEKRTQGFMISMGATAILLLGSLFGLLFKIF